MAKEFNQKAYNSARSKVFGLAAQKTAAKARSAANTAKKAKPAAKPTYTTGMMPSGQPRNYATSKPGTIRSLD